MMKKSTLTIIVAVIVFLAGGTYLYINYYGAGSGNQVITVQGTNQATSSTQAAAAPILAVASSSSWGAYLTDPKGMTLYLYTKDSQGVPTCYDQCAVIWPPYLVTPGESLSVATGITGMISTTTRTDGTIQLTYKGSPLYYYSKDAKPGDTNGQGLGSVWYIVAP